MLGINALGLHPISQWEKYGFSVGDPHMGQGKCLGAPPRLNPETQRHNSTTGLNKPSNEILRHLQPLRTFQ
jgi:hypothetical protein